MDADGRIAVIRNVLKQYPFSLGIFREIIQNSEDAKASKQVFLLDCRDHPPVKLCGRVLEHTNGPALLAFNNSTFRSEDWKGICTVYGSSKREDMSKIGKNGMGFRACFHITNYPQVFSGETMVMLDPQGDFFNKGEETFMLEDIPDEARQSLNLEWFQEVHGQDSSLGTIIRLPLRTERHRHKISTKIISCKEVENHFQSFIKTEMDISLIFLSSLQSVEFWVISEGSTGPSRIALSSITPVGSTPTDNVAIRRQVGATLRSNSRIEKDWFIRWHSVPHSESQRQLSAKLGYNVELTMIEEEKLTATVALAIQTGNFPNGYCASGRLFTYLPLPSGANYPCNIHASFALTVDRQGLRNENEEGILKESTDHVCVGWNRYLFEDVIPVAWANLLQDLSKFNPSPFFAWPSKQSVPSGCSYWQGVPDKALRLIMGNNLPVWPARGFSTLLTYYRYEEILITPPNATIALLDAFASIGLPITQPPQEVYDLLHTVKCHRLLTPELASATISGLNLETLPQDKLITFLCAVTHEGLEMVLGTAGAHLPIVPTTVDGVLTPCSRTYFNDLGPPGHKLLLPPGYFIASSAINGTLALKLGLLPLSDILDDGHHVEMKEELTTRISSVLQSYTKEQAFMEFLANAADAGATEFGITLDATQHQPLECSQTISPDLGELCAQPSLILHNNGVFSDLDWKGISSVGRDSSNTNTDGKPKIGRFGLGSLSMFYFTEVAIILSGCFVLFLDPRKAYLGKGRSCYKLSLENMKRFFPTYLSPLNGHYDYNSSMNSYNGTLFLFHLRTEEQASRSTIYEKHCDVEEIEKMINDFKSHAEHALLFIPIDKISNVDQHEHHKSWTVEKSAGDHPGFDEVVAIHHQSSSEPRLWSILSRIIPLQEIPPHLLECPSVKSIKTVSIGIAGAINNPPSHHYPFFGVPLPDTISLPIHLHCTFILSDDRRSVWYDEKGDGNLQSQFNRWLLTKKVPSLYLQFLAGWRPDYLMEKCPWWPKEKLYPDTISRVVVEAMRDTLPRSDELLCNTYSGTRIAPSKAYFYQYSSLKGFLQNLDPDNHAIIPPGFSYLPPPSLQFVDSSYLKTILENETNSVITLYKKGAITVDDIVNVVKFLQLPSLSTSLGLPLLPLADGTLKTLSKEHSTFYCPLRKHKVPWRPFLPHHFLHPVAAKEHALYDLLQVCKLDCEAISKLILDKIPAQDTYSSQSQEEWFEELWKFLDDDDTPEAKIGDPTFQHLPLIPTYSSGTSVRISWQKLARSEVISVESHNNVPLDACVVLGMNLVNLGDCSGKLREAIRNFKTEQPYRAITTFFMGLSLGSIPNCFRGLKHELHSEFSEWFRGQLRGNYYSLSSAEREIVQHLPLWESVQDSRASPRFVSASEAVVIPERISPDVIRNWTTESTAYICADPLLLCMKTPDPLPDFYRDELEFPSFMRNVTQTYKSLLEEVLRSSRPRWFGKINRLMVPNTNGVMSPCSDLYLSSHPTFAAAFALQNRKFLHREIRYLEPEFHHWDLISTITASSFEACASAIHEDISSDDIRDRALTVFRTYNTEMPSELISNRRSRIALENLRFIPRLVGGTHYGSIPADRYHFLSDIVSPSKILDPKFVSVAWTQRAVCFEEPSSELRSVNSLDSLWEPTAQEVIKHLRILSTRIAPGLPHNPGLIGDLEATYSWLNDHEYDAQGLLNYNQEELFLNVDDPATEWTWTSASELLFDKTDSSSPKSVRGFLGNYGKLLRAAGVREIHKVSIPDNLPGKASHETQLEQIMSGFSEMREAGLLTDVTFIAEDGTSFSAHRAFLATRSEHFKTCFCGKWRESMDLVEGVRIDVNYSRECLEAVLDWMYKGSYSVPENGSERLNTFEGMYRLADYWSLGNSDLFNDLTLKLIDSIGTRTYDRLRKLARDLGPGGEPLAEKCEEFERENRSALAENP